MRIFACPLRRFWLFMLIFTLLLLSAQIILADWTAPPPIEVDAPGNVGRYNSLAVVNGNPAISYRDGPNTALKFARATDINGSAWNSPIIVDNSANVGDSTSLAVINGKPAISYTDLSAYDLEFARATDANGTAWNLVTVDSADYTGINTSLAEVDGKPAISYFDFSASTLNFAYGDDEDGTTWNVVSVAACSSIDCVSSLGVVNGAPAISYYDPSAISLKFIRATDADGATWSAAPVTVDSSADVGKYSSLAVINGKPAISYWDYANKDLKYAYAGDVNGTSWNVVKVDGDDSMVVGSFTSLADINGKPAISYFDISNSALKYVRALDADGATWDPPVVLDVGNCQGYTSLAMVNGNPAISYWSALSTLKYVRSDNPTYVELSAFTAVWMSDVVQVDWTTSMEVDTAGFNLLRSTRFDGVYSQVNEVLIPSAVPGGTLGGDYTFTDQDVQVGETYFYKLEEIETGGTRSLYGPVTTESSTPTPVSLSNAKAAGYAIWVAGLLVALGLLVSLKSRSPVS